MYVLQLSPGQLDLSTLRRVHAEPVQLSLEPEARQAIRSSVETVRSVIAEGRTVYGINTGFGLLANTRIQDEELELLQRCLVLSHAAGIGQMMSPATVRLMMVLKINSLARGYSGIREEVIEALIKF